MNKDQLAIIASETEDFCEGETKDYDLSKGSVCFDKNFMQTDLLTNIQLVQKSPAKTSIDPQWAKIVVEAIGYELSDVLPIIWDYAVSFSLNLSFCYPTTVVNFTRMEMFSLLGIGFTSVHVELVCSYDLAWACPLDRIRAYSSFCLRATRVYLNNTLRRKLWDGGIYSQQHQLWWQGRRLLPLSDLPWYRPTPPPPFNIDGLSISAFVEKAKSLVSLDP